MIYAIVKTKGDRVAVYDTFDAAADAEAHVEKYGGFVFETDARIRDVLITKDGVTISPRPEPEGKLKGRAVKALLEKMLDDEMQKPNPLPEVAKLKARR